MHVTWRGARAFGDGEAAASVAYAQTSGLGWELPRARGHQGRRLRAGCEEQSRRQEASPHAIRPVIGRSQLAVGRALFLTGPAP